MEKQQAGVQTYAYLRKHCPAEGHPGSPGDLAGLKYVAMQLG